MVSAATATAATATSSKRRLSDSLKRPARSRPGRLSDKLKAPLASAAIKGGGKQPQPQPQQHKQQPQMPSTPASDDMADILKLAQSNEFSLKHMRYSLLIFIPLLITRRIQGAG